MYEDQIRLLADGVKTNNEIAAILGIHRNTVQRTLTKLDLPRRKSGGVTGAGVGGLNSQYAGGRRVLLTGYAQVLAPSSHPYRLSTGYILEHRLVMEQTLGRYLQPTEVVDYIDGLRLHNAPSNLRLFSSRVS